MDKKPSIVQLNKRGIKLVWSLHKPFWPVTLINSLLKNLLPYINIYMSAEIITEISKHGSDSFSLDRLITLIVITVAADAVVGTLRAVFMRLNTRHEALLKQKEERMFNDKYMTLDYSSLEDPVINDKRKKVEANVNIDRHGLWHMIGGVNDISSSFINIILFFSFFSGMLTTIWSNRDISAGTVIFPALLLLLAAVSAVWTLFISKHVAKISNEVSENMYRIIRLNQALGAHPNDYNLGKDIRIYRQDWILLEESRNRAESHRKSFAKYYKRMYFYRTPETIINQVINAVVYVFICLNALRGLFGFGSVIKYAGYIGRFMESLNLMIVWVSRLKENSPFLAEYFEYLDVPHNMYMGTIPVEKRDDNEYEIEFRNVSFKYPGSDNYALKNLSFKFKIGEKLAVVGMNGSGKTTMIKLLCRLYDPTEGEVLLNGIDVKKYSYEEYLGIFSVVFQDFKLFSFPVGDNVAASVDYNETEITKCLNDSGFEERLKDMPLGLKTPLYKDFENDGVEISGGEAQKIALARALYKSAPFIILDEPTAALDPIAEFEIYKKFDTLVGEKTAVYISHRLSSTRFCDNIFVFHEGKLTQRGGHEELLADESGKYHELWHAQAQYYA